MACRDTDGREETYTDKLGQTMTHRDKLGQTMTPKVAHRHGWTVNDMHWSTMTRWLDAFVHDRDAQWHAETPTDVQRRK